MSSGVPEQFLIEPHDHPVWEIYRQLLETSDVTVTALAFSLGFSSSQHFARVFRQLAGTTPTGYRSSSTAGGRVG